VQSRLLALGYLAAILATIRVGEKLLQRFGGAIGILFNLFMMVVAIIAIMVTVPSERSDKRPEVPATPSIGS